MTHEQRFAWQVLSEFLGDRIQAPPPKFALGTEVRSVWLDENNQQRASLGFIVGIFPAPKNWAAGWWYLVRLTDVDGHGWLELPYDDESHESELELAGQDAI